MKFTRLLAILLLVTAAVTPAGATANEAPLPDAGLDQSVTRGSTVHLDGGGSRDPDGTINDYTWTVEAPNGTTTTLDCIDCERTSFRPTTVGEYTVTLAVTDDDGATATDALYVDVEPGAPPTVSLAGPSGLLVGERGEYTATVSAESAPLDRLVWYADDERYATTDVNGTAATADQRFQFPDVGTHELRVVAIDEDEQRANATRAVDVDVGTAGSVDPTDPNDGTTTESPTPDLRGPRVVTGDTVLDATYSLTNDTITADWFLDDRHVGVGNAATLTLSAGTHELYASPDSGGVSTFPDGSRNVLADPAPAVHIERVTEESIVTVDAYATDELGNLQSLEVLVDGEVRKSSSLGGIERRASRGDRLANVYRLTDVSPGDRNITVRAMDSRGQTTSESRIIRVPGPPEVVNARFVNDEPLTSKHPKLDPEDYTAQFQIDVDLNGVDPKYIEAAFETRRRNTSMEQKARYPDSGWGLSIIQNFSSSYKGTIHPAGEITWRRGNNRRIIGTKSDKTVVKLSKPVIRLDLVKAQNNLSGRGATFDASESFDPDGSKLSYHWNDVNSTAEWYGPTNRLHPRKLMYLSAMDQQGQQNRTFGILDWFTPGLQTPELRDAEPVFPQETVTYRVRTNHYELSKSVYEKENFGKAIDFELVSEAGSVSNHLRYARDENAGRFDQNLPEDFNQAFIFHQWNVTVPASEFLGDDNPTVRIQSTRQSESFREVELPAPEMYNQVRTSTTLTEFDTKYVEERPEYDVRETARKDYKEALQRLGFDLYSARQTGTEYYLEKRVKTESAQWETITRDFDREFQRQLFLEGKTDWNTDGSSEQRRQRTVVDRVWRDSRGGSGEFTGKTRSVRVEPAETETVREYEYTETYEVEVTVEEERERCLPMMGCQTYTVETTEERDRTRTVSYWSSRPRNPSHRRTGNTRTRTVERAEYEQQYQFRVEDTETYWEDVYHASTQEKVQSAQYEWQPHKSVKTKRIAAIATTNSDVRVSDTEPTREWTLRRQDGTFERTTSTPEERFRVVETRMTATASIEAEFLPPNPTIRSKTVTKDRTVDVAHNVSRFVTTEEAKNIIRNEANRTHADDY